MTNQVWYDDPRRLTFLLARYKFVAKMFAGCRNVGEVGCGDAFGTRVVLQEVPDVTVYDFDPLFIQDVRARRDERWPLKAEVHDIVAAPLPRKHEALFSLDVIEHIAPMNEHAYLANLCESLTENGLLMIGTPSLESQAYASPPSKAGHINCKTSTELKALLEKYFEHVFVFSMNDEVVHTGFSSMAHYLFALCSTPKWEGSDFKRRSSSESARIRDLRSPRRLRILCASDPSQYRAAKGRRLCHRRRRGALDRHPGAELVQIRSSVVLLTPARKLARFAMASSLRIGIDFDNTIITYDDVFRAAAEASGLIASGFSGNKQAVRDAIRRLPDGELAWQRLQGQVYGKGIGGATMVAGVETFLRRCRAEGCAVVVVSHKTEYGHFDPDRVNLRKAALDWMAGQGLLGGDHGIALANIYFESTRAEKLKRIAALSLTHFIDDLEEVLTDPDFPPDVERILFADGAQPASPSYISCSTWRDIERQVFGGAGS